MTRVPNAVPKPCARKKTGAVSADNVSERRSCNACESAGSLLPRGEGAKKLVPPSLRCATNNEHRGACAFGLGRGGAGGACAKSAQCQLLGTGHD